MDLTNVVQMLVISLLFRNNFIMCSARLVTYVEMT